MADPTEAPSIHEKKAKLCHSLIGWWHQHLVEAVANKDYELARTVLSEIGSEEYEIRSLAKAEAERTKGIQP